MYTLGTSEWVYTPVNSAYTAKDAIDRGASDSEAIVGGLVRAGTDVVIGKLFVGGLSLTGKAIKYVLPGTSKAVGKLVTNVAGKLTKAFQGAPKPQPIPTARLDSVNRALQNALRKGDEKALLNLYKNGGMKEIGKLEQLGHVSPEAAKQLNTALTKTVNRAIDTGTGRAINTFQKNTGVGIRRVNVGDSGSSAKGGTRSVTTDFDRTTVPEFEPKSLNDYAKRNGLTPAQAEKQLKKEFCDNHFSTQVDDALKETGLPGGAKDVDFKGYDGIGAKAGPSDSYSYGYTSRRQAIGGKTKVYVPDKDGGVRSYETSGQATVDADGLSKGRVEGALPDAPGKVPPGELPGVIKEQIKSAAKHDDVKSLAKALGRTGEAADTLGIHNPDLDKLRDITQQINKNPQQMDTILQNNGMTSKDYIQSTRSIIKEIDNVASQLEF